MLNSLLLVVAAAVVSATVEDSQLAPTPPMGFNNWARFELNLNQTLFTDTADAMVSNGMRDAGYNRLNLDDAWLNHSRDSEGRQTWDTQKFPDGLIWLGKYFKERGFKFGIYSDIDKETCGKYPGSLGYEHIDAETYVSWGVDYLKLDGCYKNIPQGTSKRDLYIDLYAKWHDVIQNLSSPLVFSESAPCYFSEDYGPPLQEWYEVMNTMPQHGELARICWDISTYDQTSPWTQVLRNYAATTLVARYQKPGYFNDPDFLISDNPHLSSDEMRSQFALWASFSAPLIVSANIPGLPQSTIDVLTNKDLIAVDQDSLGLQATLVSQNGNFDVLTKSLSNGDRLLTILNRGSTTESIDVPLARVGLSNPNADHQIKDLWTGSTSTVSGKVSVSNLRSHQTAVYRLSKADGESVTETGQIFWAPTNGYWGSNFQCLDASTGTFSKCAGTDAQVWTVKGKGSGRITNLADGSKVLKDDGGKVSFEADAGDASTWSYTLSGNLINKATQKCLTLNNGALSTSTCGQTSLSQIFSVPIQPYDV